MVGQDLCQDNCTARFGNIKAILVLMKAGTDKYYEEMAKRKGYFQVPQVFIPFTFFISFVFN